MKKEKRFNILDYYENVVIRNVTEEQTKIFIDMYGSSGEIYLLQEIHDTDIED